MKRVFLVSCCEFLNIAVQFSNFILMGSIFGAQPGMDAFMTSVALPMVLVAVTTGPLISSLVPLLVEVKKEKDATALARYKSNLLNLFGSGGILLALLLLASSGLLVYLIAPGLDPRLRELAAAMLRIEAIAVPLSVASGVLISFYYAEEQFLRPTVAPFFGGLAGIAVILFLNQPLGIRVLPWAMVANAGVQFFSMLGIARNHSWQYSWKDEQVRKLARKMLPLSAGNMYYKSDSLVDRFILSFLPVGSISYLGYGQRVVTVIGQVLSRGLVTTRFTELSAHGLSNMPEFREKLNRLFIQSCLLIAPIVVSLAIFIRPLLHYVLERGAFSAMDVRRTAAVIIAFLGLLVGGLLGSVLANAFYALGDTKTITLIGVTTFTLGIGLKVFAVHLFSYVGVALATSLYFLLAVGVEMTVLQKKIHVFSWQRTGSHLLKIAAAASLASIAGMLLRKALPGGFIFLLVGLALTGAVYLLFSLWFRTIRRHELPFFHGKHASEKKPEI